ncbi:MAG: ferredoxin [Bdellovibrionales bacterium]
MANKNNKYSENVVGSFYVDKDCIHCDACVLAAENHFKLHEEEGYAFVYKQPTTTEEKEFCQEALESCPVEAIGDDGV